MNLSGHSDLKYITGTRLASSAGRDWSSILVERWRHAKGRLNDVKPRETEVVVLLSGRMRVRRRGDGHVQECFAVPGTVWLRPAGIQERDIEIDGDMDEIVHMYTPPEPFSNASLREFDINPERTQLGHCGGFRDALITQIGRSMADEIHTPSSAGVLLVDTLRVSLSAHLLRHYLSMSGRRMGLPPTNGALDGRRLKRVLEFIDDNIERNIRLDELADIACLSPYHFARTFKASTGAAPHRYLMAQKLDLAKSLLAADDLKLVEIALRTGFANQAHFNRAFKRATGMTPGSYRKNAAGPRAGGL